MRRANGTGGICKLKGKHRKPWRVRITTGWELNEETGKARAKLKVLGDFHTRVEAEKALNEYLACPYEIGTKDITFEELYEKWIEWYFENKATTVSSQRSVTSAFAYCKPIYKVKARDLRVRHFEDCMNTGYIIVPNGKDKGQRRYASAGTKNRMKSLFNLVMDYAVRHEIVLKNYARDFKVDESIRQDIRKSAKKKLPFSYEELQLLWENVDSVKFVDMILIGVYTGFRPKELATLKVSGVDFEENVLVGGMKTEAGIDRRVPIHADILPLVKTRYEEAQELGSEYLFNDAEGQRGNYMTYDKYRVRFGKVMQRLNMKHSPHEARHTFITIAKSCEMNDNIIKLIVGHAIPDITEKVYTHRTFEQLRKEMEKFKPSENMNNIDANIFLSKLYA